MTLTMSNVINKKQLLREISGLELCCLDDTTRSFKYATIEGIQDQIDIVTFKPLAQFVNEGQELVPKYIDIDMAEKLYNDRIEMLNNLNIDTDNIDKYVFAPFFVLSHEPSIVKEGTMKTTMHQMRMIKEK